MTKTSCAISEDLDALIRVAVRRAPAGPRILAIDGRSGSGKTTCAQRLAARLGAEDSVVVHMDDFYDGWDGLAGAPAYLTATVLEPLSRGEEGRFAPWDWHQRRRCGETVVPRREWVIIEGVGSGSRVARSYLAALVWLEADEQVRKQRGLDRDGESFRPHWDRWAAQEDALFEAEQTKDHVDLVIKT